MHLARYCTGPTLLCNTHKGLLPSKRSTEQMRSESYRTTFQQQIRMFDSLASDVSFPTRNPLHSMPSLVHLSSTQSELEYSNVNYAGFDINYSLPDTAGDEMNIIDDRIPVFPVIEKCSFQQNNMEKVSNNTHLIHVVLSGPSQLVVHSKNRTKYHQLK